jgi:hypothetical protein
MLKQGQAIACQGGVTLHNAWDQRFEADAQLFKLGLTSITNSETFGHHRVIERVGDLLFEHRPVRCGVFWKMLHRRGNETLAADLYKRVTVRKHLGTVDHAGT